MAVIRPLIVGFATTFKYLFKKPITVNYPHQKVPMFPKWRGKQVLMRDEHGLEKCVACGLCSFACPADAIYLEAAEKGLILGKGKRPKKASTLYIDRGRIERHILRLLGSRRVRDLTTPDILRFMRDVTTGKTADGVSRSRDHRRRSRHGIAYGWSIRRNPVVCGFGGNHRVKPRSRGEAAGR